MSNNYYPIHFTYPKSGKYFSTTIQKLYYEMETNKRNDLLQEARKHQCTFTCHCQKDKPLPLTSVEKDSLFLRVLPNTGHLHQTDCFFYRPASEEQAYWNSEQSSIQLPFSLEKQIYEKKGNTQAPRGSNSSYRPTFKTFCEQLLARTQTHFMHTALKKDRSLRPSMSEFHFFFKSKLTSFSSCENIPLSSFYLETPTLSDINKHKRELESHYLLNWSFVRFFIASPVVEITTFEFNRTLYTKVDLMHPKTKELYSLAYKGDLLQTLPKKLQGLLTKPSNFAHFWLMGWLPFTQSNTPSFNGEPLPLLSSQTYLYCLSLNGLVVRQYEELLVFNQFAFKKQALRSCFQGDTHSPIKGEFLPTALWLRSPSSKPSYEAIQITPPYQKREVSEVLQKQLQEEDIPLWSWNLSKTKERPLLPFE